MDEKIITTGNCRLCNVSLEQKKIKRHIIKCTKNLKQKNDAYLIYVHCDHYWVYLSIPINKTLKNFDLFLRELWLECCGHLSCFTINKKRYESYKEYKDELDMNIKLTKVLNEGIKFYYEYDFGTTTMLNIECLSLIKTDSNNIVILARNQEPIYKCDCGNIAKEICCSCAWDENGFLCKNCEKEHKCEESYFLPIVNSPRIGLCGFTGDDCSLIDN